MKSNSKKRFFFSAVITITIMLVFAFAVLTAMLTKYDVGFVIAVPWVLVGLYIFILVRYFVKERKRRK